MSAEAVLFVTDEPKLGTKSAMSAASVVSSAEVSPVGLVRPTFDEVYGEYFDFVWLSLRRLGVASGALDDATQDVFVVVYRKLEEFEFRSQLKTWLFSLAMRVAQTHRRKSRPAPVDYQLEQVPDTGSSPHETAARAQALQTMDQILNGMDDERRAVFIMAELEQLPIVEIAEVLGLKLNTAYSRLRLARETFNAELKRHRARDEWRQT